MRHSGLLLRRRVEITLSLISGLGRTQPDLQARFKTFLMSKYSLKEASPTCGLVDTESTAGSTLRLWTLDARRRGGKIIDTGWLGR